MPKKLIIPSAALLLLAALIIILANAAGGRGKSELPARVSVYDREAGTIYTPTYEELLCGTVAGMIPPNTQPETEMIKAAAIAENTRLRCFLNDEKNFDDMNLGAQFIVSESVPYSPDEPREEIKAAVKTVLNTYLTYENELWNVPLCGISTGRTDACPPYSPSLALPYDINAGDFESSAEFSPEEVRRRLGGGHLSYNYIEWFHDPVYGENGTLLFIGFDEQRVTGDTLKAAFGLRSTAITVDYGEDMFRFRCLGYGNNRGMSLHAANCLAREGMSAEEILRFFFPDAKTEKDRS